MEVALRSLVVRIITFCTEAGYYNYRVPAGRHAITRIDALFRVSKNLSNQRVPYQSRHR